MGLRSYVKRMVAWASRLAGAATARWTDELYLSPDVPSPNLTTHTTFGAQVIAAVGPGRRVLEIGSREVTGSYGLRDELPPGGYVGFDYYPGPNVDVIGDAHRLSSYFDERFDVIYSTAVLEHLAMPWVAAEEIAKTLKVGGMVFIQTHFSYSLHERPWHFFQFSDMGLKVLFSPALGFECVEASLQNPIVGRFSHLADRYLRLEPVTGLYCHASFIGRKVREVEDFSWNSASIDTVAGATVYPRTD